MARRKCRIWWPEQLSSHTPSSDLLLFGWFVDSVSSVDIVVAAAATPSDVSLRLRQSDLQEILHSANRKMPMPLQECAVFSLLGHCAADLNNQDLKISKQNNGWLSRSSSEHQQGFGVRPNTPLKIIDCQGVNKICHQESSDKVSFTGSCACEKLDQFTEPYRHVSVRSDIWIQLLYRRRRFVFKETRWIPQLHHMHLSGQILAISDVHLMMYDLPTNGRHHFALSSWGFSQGVETTFKKPNWFGEIHNKPVLDLDTVVLALNCANEANACIERSLGSKSLAVHFRCKAMLASMLWHTVAVLVASVSTSVYIILQFFHSSLSYGSLSFFFGILAKVFRYTWKNVHIRSCQYMYWPIYLQDSCFRSHANVEYAHKAALRRHAMWSNVAMDILLGIIFGVALLAHLSAICSQLLFVVHYITDNLLRSGCVWLMGVPAGFKLNTELAELLGIVSLNAIQVFSTLWFFMGYILWYLVEGLAFAGILLGMTVPVALCIDMLKLSTFHISTLHRLMSVLYSQQIQALASLWRLFRGRKWNPLRQRLDSYDYTVKQHVLGSLLFTPVLLLLPTTSVFYIFFTNLNTSISLICITMEIMVSILHATPYAEILLWIMKRGRFPSGIWLEIKPSQAASASANYGSSGEGYSPSKSNYLADGGSGLLVSLLRSNYATIALCTDILKLGNMQGKLLHHIIGMYFTEFLHPFVNHGLMESLAGKEPPLPWELLFLQLYLGCISALANTGGCAIVLSSHADIDFDGDIDFWLQLTTYLKPSFRKYYGGFVTLLPNAQTLILA